MIRYCTVPQPPLGSLPFRLLVQSLRIANLETKLLQAHIIARNRVTSAANGFEVPSLIIKVDVDIFTGAIRVLSWTCA